MNTTRIKKVLSWKNCSFFGCTNTFYGSQFQSFCTDERCITLRKAEYKETKKSKLKTNVSQNRILKKSLIKGRIPTGQVLNIRCKAVDSNGDRCTCTSRSVYDPKVEMYPKYCKYHRNIYQRERFAQIGVINAEGRI